MNQDRDTRRLISTGLLRAKRPLGITPASAQPPKVSLLYEKTFEHSCQQLLRSTQ